MKFEYYMNPDFLKMPNEKFWAVGAAERWIQDYNSFINPILKELGLVEDESAIALAKNLWYSKNATEELIREQLELYKHYKN